MSLTVLIGFTVVAVLAIITPGLDTMLVLRKSVLAGRRGGLAASVGITLGCLVWAIASIVGLSALLTASRLAYDVVRLAGVAYLLWLGGSALWKSVVRRSTPPGVDEAPQVTGGAAGPAALRAGLTTNLLNPKVGVFYISLLPQFLPAGPGSAAWGALLVLIHLTLTVGWLSGLVWLAGRARGLFRRERVRRWMDRVTASVLIGLGVKLALEPR